VDGLAALGQIGNSLNNEIFAGFHAFILTDFEIANYSIKKAHAGACAFHSNSCAFLRRFGGPFSVYADELTLAALVFEFNEALDQRKERIVLSAADVFAGLPFGSALTGKNIAAEHLFAAEFL
jgi:hypothetical protein